MTPSITRDFAIRPVKEKRPVVGSKMKQAATVMRRSTTKRAEPMLKLVYFFRIMARISVPPPEAPMSKRMAALKAGRKIAKISSSTGWVVRGWDIGRIFSMPLKATDISTLT